MRIVHFFVRNWALKLGAVALAVILYVAMISIQATQQWPGDVAIEPVNQPVGSYLLNPDSLKVDRIRYIAGPEVPISSASFRATVDLREAKVGPADSSLVKVQLVAEDPRIQVIDYQPQQIRVTLDRIVSKTVPVTVVTLVPEGLSKGPQTLSSGEVTVTGASTAVARVSAARARVQADASGLDINEDAPLEPIDSAGKSVDNVQLTPASIHIRVQIGSQLRTATVPVTPVIVDSPASGYYITAIDVTPDVVAVSGQANALSLLNGVAATAPVSIRGATGDVTVNVALVLPSGVEAQGVTTVKVTVHLVSPASTRTVSIGIVAVGARSDRTYAFSTSNVIVTLGGATADLNAFNTSTFVATVSVAGLDAGSHLVVLTISPPAGIKVVAMSVTQIVVIVTVGPPPPAPTPSPTP